jgi:CheY-like chemotaxis protein
MSTPKSPSKKILVVDDETLVCETLGMLLTFDGHTIVTAGNGKQALALFEQDRFDLVITDYKMPEMMGDELVQAIKARVPDQPVIMLTAHAEMLQTEVTPLKGVDQLVSKPFQLADLRDAIQKVTAH